MKTHPTKQTCTAPNSAFRISFLAVLQFALFQFSPHLLAVDYTWTTTTTGTNTWFDTANWDSASAPVSGTDTIVHFLPSNATVLSSSTAIVAAQDIDFPLVLNQLNINGTGPATDSASITISNSPLQFDGAGAALNVNAAYGSGGGLTVNLNTDLAFNAPTAINFGPGGAFVNIGSSVAISGTGAITFNGALANRPLSLSAGSSAYSGNVNVNSGILQLNQNHNILGFNVSSAAPGTQTVSVASGASVVLAYGDAAYTQNQYFALNGPGNGSTASLQVNGVDFGSGNIGGLALSGSSTVSVNRNGADANPAHGLVLNGMIVGSGTLTKTGNGALIIGKVSGTQTLNGVTYNPFSGNINVNGGRLVLQGGVSDQLGTNLSGTGTQTVSVADGASAVIAYGDAAFTNRQYFALSGSGDGVLPALAITGVNFGNGVIGGLAVTGSTGIAINPNTANYGVTVTNGIVGSGTLTKTGNGALIINTASAAKTLNGTAYSAFTGNVNVNGGRLVLQGGVSNILGTNLSGTGTQTVSVADGASTVIAFGDGAFTNNQYFALTGSGDGVNPALAITGINFGNGVIGGLAVTGSTGIAINPNTANYGVTVTNGIVGSGTLTKTGNGALIINTASVAKTLNGTAYSAFTGDVNVNGGYMQLGQAHNMLGTNSGTTQTITVASNAGVNLAYGNGAYNQLQNFVLSGTGNSATSGAALNITGINFGNGSIGGLALASDATIRIVPLNTGEARAVTVSRGMVGAGTLTKIGSGYLLLTTAVPGSPVTWGGTSFSGFTGNVNIVEGVIQTTAGPNNQLGTSATQRVTISSGAAFGHGSATNANTQPQTFILNGNGTGFIANVGGFAAFDSFGTAFGQNNIGRLVLASDASVSVKRDAGSNGLGNGLASSNGVAGAGTLTVGATYGSATAPLYVSASSAAFSEFGAFSGKVVVNNGMLSIGNTYALGATGTAGQVTLSGLGALASGNGIAINQDFIGRVANATTTGGVFALGANSSNNLDFSTYLNARLGASTSQTYSGTLTPYGTTYRLGGGGGTLTVSSQLTGSNSVVVSGGVTLTNSNNNFSGGIQIVGNNPGVGQTAILNLSGTTGAIPTTSSLAFGGLGGSFILTGGSTGSATSLGALSFGSGLGQVTSTFNTSGTTSLTFASLSARTAGASGNFTTSGGTNGTTNKITITAQGTGLIDKGVFFNGADYAYNDATGFLRAPVYGTDAGFVTTAGTTTIAGATHQQITGGLTAQNTATFSTLKITATNAVTLAASQVVTVDGLLKSGGNAVTISGGSGVQASSGSEMVVNTNASGDSITVSNGILDNGGSSLTKTGVGTLTLNGTNNTYSGGTTIAAGVLTVSGAGGLANSGAVNVTGGTYNVNIADTVGAVTLKNGIIGGSAVLTGASYSLENGAVNIVLAGSGVNLVKSTPGAVFLTATSSYSGNTTVQGGSLIVSNATSTNPLSASPNLIVGDTLGNNSGILDVLGVSKGFTLATGQTLSGFGTVLGNVGLPANSAINFSSGATLKGAVAVTGGTWSGLGTVTGTVTSSANTFTIGTGANLTANSGVNVTGGSITAGGSSSTITGSLNYTSATSSTFAGIIAGAASTVTVNNPATSLTLSGSNSYNGLTDVQSGTLSLAGVGGTIADAAAVQVSGGVLNVAQSDTVGAVTLVSGTISGENTLTGSSYDVRSGAVSAMLAGGTGTALTKTTSGTVVLSGSNSYGGATNVNNGTLAFAVSETLTGGLNVATSGTAVLTAHTGGAANVKVLDITGLTISGTTTFAGGGGKDLRGFVQASPVPEPGTIGLLAVGAIGGLLLRRRNRKSSN